MFDPPIATTGIIKAVIVNDSPQPTIYHVELPNGKMAIGHIPKSLILLHDSLATGIKVDLELTPFDFEKARIVRVSSK